MSWENSFRGKTVIVTGGGRGIGRALCVELHKFGATVYAVSKNPDNLKSLVSECPSIKSVCVDLGDWDATREAIEKIEAVDMLVNNAGICIPGGFFEITSEDFDAQCSVNLKAVINVSQVVGKKMMDSEKPGSIVNISSLSGLKAMPCVSAYSTLKAGLEQLTKIMAAEMGKSNVTVNCVSPVTVITDMSTSAQAKADVLTPEQQQEFYKKFSDRILTMEMVVDMKQVINTVLFLLSDSAPMITGTTIPLDGGYNAS